VVRRDETEPFVEAECVGSTDVGRQLDQVSSSRDGSLDRPGEQLLADPGAADVMGHPHPLDLGTDTAEREVAQERELEDTDDVTVDGGDDQFVHVAGSDLVEGVHVDGRQGLERPLAFSPELVVDEQRHDLRHVGSCRRTDLDGRSGAVAHGVVLLRGLELNLGAEDSVCPVAAGRVDTSPTGSVG
jgi:hypothetical protein